MIVLYVFAGINHFWHPRMYMKIMPSFRLAPCPWSTPAASAEIAFALLLIPTSTRWLGRLAAHRLC